MSYVDLFELLMAGRRVPHGRYDHATWTVTTAGDALSSEAQVASVHLIDETRFDFLALRSAYAARGQARGCFGP